MIDRMVCAFSCEGWQAIIETVLGFDNASLSDAKEGTCALMPREMGLSQEIVSLT